MVTFVLGKANDSALDLGVEDSRALMVYQSMTIGAQSNQIPLAVASQVISGLDVMDLQVPLSSTKLAPPPITAQDVLT
jgi:hypothetical protein